MYLKDNFNFTTLLTSVLCLHFADMNTFEMLIMFDDAYMKLSGC